MSPETADPGRLRLRVLARIAAQLAAPGLTPGNRSDLEAQRAFWRGATYATLNDLVNCYEPGADAV